MPDANLHRFDWGWAKKIRLLTSVWFAFSVLVLGDSLLPLAVWILNTSKELSALSLSLDQPAIRALRASWKGRSATAEQISGMSLIIDRESFAADVARSKHLTTEPSMLTLKIDGSFLRGLRQHSAATSTAPMVSNVGFA